MAPQSVQFDAQDDLHEVSQTLQKLLPRLLQTTQDVKDEPIISIASTIDVPWLQSIAIPGDPHDIEHVFQELSSICHHRIRVNHPHFMGLIPSPTHPTAWLGDVITGAFNALGASKLQASGPVAVEKRLTEWLATKIGLTGENRGGIFVSGGSMSNMMALVAARDRHLTTSQRSRAVAYVSSETHYSVIKAFRIIGFEVGQIRRIPVDELFRMDTGLLTKQILEDRRCGLVPFVVIASCGTTNTGTVDPLEAIGTICKRQNIWMHVDGAYGASVALSNSHRHLVAGLSHADSVSWDAHKWLFQTYSCGILLVNDTNNLRRSFANEGEYLRDGDAMLDEDIPQFWNYTMELTRPSRRVLKLWFTLRVLGLERIGRMIDHAFDLAAVAEETLTKLPNWTVISSASDSLAILNFRYCRHAWSELETDTFNANVSKKLLKKNIAGILTTRVRGMVALRICALSPYLKATEMVQVIHQIDAHATGLIEKASA